MTFERKQKQKFHKLAGESVMHSRSHLSVKAFLGKAR